MQRILLFAKTEKNASCVYGGVYRIDERASYNARMR